MHPAHNREYSANFAAVSILQAELCCAPYVWRTRREKVATEYADAYHTAHLEVGEMFELAVAASKGRGVVGSTSNILQFILQKVDWRFSLMRL